MTMNCANCTSDNTQTIKAILASGTTFSSGTVSGTFVGTSAGVVTGTAHHQSLTALASRFSRPQKPSKMEIIGGGVLTLAFSPFLGAGVPWVILPLAVGAWWLWEAKKYREKSREYQENYPKWKQLHDHGIYCHRCGSVSVS